MNQELNLTVALCLLRVVTGILFFYQGCDKIFNVKIEGVVQAFMDSIRQTWVPRVFLRPFAVITSYIEMIAGLFLIFGLFRDASLYLLSFNLILVAFAFSSIKAMWDMQYFFPRMVFVVALLLLPSESDRWSLDFLLRQVQ